MRSPILIGVFSGILVAIAGIALLVSILLDTVPPVARRSPSPSPAASSVPPSPSPATSTPTPTSTRATASASSTPSIPPTESPIPSATTPATPAPTQSPSGIRPPITLPPAGPTGTGVGVGDRAPALAVPGLDGETVETAALAGRPVWLNFMATWCPPCREELPMMERFQAQLGDDLVIVLVDVREERTTVDAFMRALDVDLPVGLDETGAAQREWGAFALPMHYWLDGTGVVRGFVFGGAGPDQLIEGVRTVVPGASLEP